MIPSCKKHFEIISSVKQLGDFSGILLVTSAEIIRKEGLAKALEVIPPDIAQMLGRAIKIRQFKFEPGALLSFDTGPEQKVVLLIAPKGYATFDRLESARKALEPFKEARCSKVLCYLAPVLSVEAWVDALVSAVEVLSFRLPIRKKENPKTELHLSLCVKPSDQKLAEKVGLRAFQLAQGTNRVRYLATLSGNELTPQRYVEMVRAFAKENDFKFDFFPVEKLEEMGAGAFHAVAKGGKDPGMGIVRLTYPGTSPKTRPLAIVGKGVTFDTGGTNLKTGEHLYGMHEDMTGSAVVLGLMGFAKEAGWAWPVHGYLAIVENAISPDSYRPNDIVKALNGKTIEVIDTDAEGRMILSDTLTLASREKPALMIDFATLTGTCVRAIGTSYSGGFSNRRSLLSKIRVAGRESGERVWPFPNDLDFGRCLKSEVADIMQCRLKGGSDHIEASYFLSQFVPKSVPWVHIDLSACNAEGGLAHVPTKTTGFGVRFGAALMETVMPELG